MHVCMSYCDFSSLKILLRNYLGYEEEDVNDDVLKEMERVVEKAEMTPADVSEALIKNRRDKEKAVRELLVELKSRWERNVKGGKLRGQSGNLRELEIVEEEEKRAIDSQNEDGDDVEDETELVDNVGKD